MRGFRLTGTDSTFETQTYWLLKTQSCAAENSSLSERLRCSWELKKYLSFLGFFSSASSKINVFKANECVRQSEQKVRCFLSPREKSVVPFFQQHNSESFLLEAAHWLNVWNFAGSWNGVEEVSVNENQGCEAPRCSSSVKETLSPCHETTSTVVEFFAVRGISLSARRPSLQKGLLWRSYNFHKNMNLGLVSWHAKFDLVWIFCVMKQVPNSCFLERWRIAFKVRLANPFLTRGRFVSNENGLSKKPAQFKRLPVCRGISFLVFFHTRSRVFCAEVDQGPKITFRQFQKYACHQKLSCKCWIW